MLERRLSLRHLLFAGACIAVACAEAENTDSDDGSSGGSGGASGGSGGVVGKGGSVAKGGSSGSSGSSQGGSGGKGGSAGSTAKGGSTSAGGTGGTVTTPPPLGCLPMGEGGAGGDTGTAGEGGMPGTAGDSAGGSSGSSGSAGSGGTSGSGGSAGSGGTPGAGGDAAGGAAGADGMGAPLFFDDFESGAGAWTPFANWSVIADGSNVYTESDTGTPLRLSMATGTCWADQVVEARIKIVDFPGMSTGYFAAIFARVVDAENAYFAAIDSSNATKFTVRRLIGGSIEKIGGEATVQITRGNWYDIKFEVIGTTLRATFTDNAMTHVLTEMDARIASGGVGVGVKNGDARFDDVRVTAP